MKKSLADLLTIYLYEKRYLSLPKLGRFVVSDEEDLSKPESIEFTRIPKGLIQFNYNSEEDTDTELIRYITDHTRKMQSLALADLFTFTDQARQMLNLLQPVSFPGIGTVGKESDNEISFEPGIYRPELLSDTADYTQQTNFSSMSSTSTQTSSSSSSGSVANRPNRSAGGMLVIFICIIIAGVLVYFIFSNKGEDTNDRMSTQVENSGDSTVQSNQLKKGQKLKQNKKQARWTSVPPKKKGEIHYQVVFEHGVDSSRAFRKYRQLTGWGHLVVVTTQDSIHYDVAIPTSSLVSDTTKMKDSIRILYGRPTTIRYKTGD